MEGGRRLRSDLFRVVVICLLVFAPVAVVISYAASSAMAREVVWQDPAIAGSGGVRGIPLEEGGWYHLVLETDCFSGANYSTHFSVVSESGHVALLDWSHDLFASRWGACRSTVTTREFEAASTGFHTLRWDGSSEVMGHHPRVRLEKVGLPLDRAIQFSVLAVYGGLNVFPSVLVMLALRQRRRPPGRMPTSVPSPAGVARTLATP